MVEGSAARAMDSPPPGREVRFRFTPGERDVFRRVPFLAPSAWAEQHYVVMDGPMAGARWRNSVAPYLAGIMDAMMEDGVEMVVCPGSPQVGKTAALHICLGYSADRLPGPKMLAMDNEQNMSKVVSNKLLPNYKASPLLRGKLVSSKATELRFRDGSVCYLACASSASQRASVSVRVLCMDEEDLYEVQAGKAHPVDEFLERATSFESARKVVRISKPLGVDGESSIEIALSACDELRRYEARCPVCQHYQVMGLEGFIPLEGEKDPARIRRERLGRYKCADCGTLWSDSYRNFAVRNGRWRPERPVRRPRSVGFHLPSFISPFVSLSDILADHIEAQTEGTPAKLTHFYNSRCAATWKPVVAETPASLVLSCVDPAQPPRVVPAGAAFLTCGIDMQKTGFPFTVWAWWPSREARLIDHGFLPDFESVRALVFDTRYDREDGGSIHIHRAGLDTGGGKAEEGSASMTERAYRFILNCPPGRLYAVKGASRAFEKRVLPKVIGKLPSTKMPIPGSGLVLYFLDTGYFKELAHAAFKPDAPHPAHLHAETGQDFADQIAAERQVLRKGALVWEKVARANHYLDCTMISWACGSVEWAPSLQGLWVAHRRQEEMARVAEEAAAGEAQKVNPFTGGRRIFGR